MTEDQLLSFVAHSLVRPADPETYPQPNERSRKAALEELLRRHYDWVTRVCLLEISDAALALDCVQEVMVQVAKSIDRFDGRSELKTWMYVIVKRTVGKFRRRENLLRKRFQTGSNEDLEKERQGKLTVKDAQDLEQGLLSSEKNRVLIELVRQLPRAQRHAVLLHYFEDLKVEDAARQMGCSASSFKTHLFRARKKLAKWIEQCPDEYEALIKETK